MADLQAIRTALKTRLDALGISGLTVYDAWPKLLNAPCLVISPQRAEYEQTFGATPGVKIPLELHLFVKLAGGRENAQDNIDPYLATSQAGALVSITSIADGGSGNQVGDIFTVDPVPGATAATFRVTAVDGAGAVTGLVIVTRGKGYPAGSFPLDADGGSGTAIVVNATASATGGSIQSAIENDRTLGGTVWGTFLTGWEHLGEVDISDGVSFVGAVLSAEIWSS